MRSADRKVDLLITGIGRLVTPVGSHPRGGKEMAVLKEIPQAAIAIAGGRIVLADAEATVLRALGDAVIGEVLDAGGRLAMPGLVDAHTHLVHAGSREHESALKRSGVPYLEILARGGGILSTMKATRTASEQALYDQARRSLDEMLLQGTTTVEAKSGYGLCLEDELKQLSVTRELSKTHPIELVSTFMGAHAVPPEYQGRPDAYVELVVDVMLPKVAEAGLASFCDVFCERGVFTQEQSRRILTEAKRHGLRPKIHADELESLGGLQLAAEVGATSAEHLLVSDDAGLQALADGGVIPVLLPGTSFNLGLNKHARAREMMDQFHLPVTLATDYNPGSSPTESMQLIMALAQIHLRMTPEEIVTACTINAANAIGRGSEIGTLEAGKQADVVIFDVPTLAYLPYHFGINHTFGVIKKGRAAVWNRRLVQG
ncbi:imidazolonepropionase [Paenibacillus cremeus]|uniref:Imidazolonepropionase n=1 Tax=Paenibacillus cremeus TaxID=2163881 RepID=A0A559JMD6_9BACL|nr:imidazolonepropionase [Paenibacillus cremeus]TVY01041.1 imidazolonepropionase [Paenibacillus cremeus]